MTRPEESDCEAAGRPKVYLDPPPLHWKRAGDRGIVDLTRAHSTNNCAPAPPSKEPGARPVFQYLVSCQPGLLLPTCVSNLDDDEEDDNDEEENGEEQEDNDDDNEEEEVSCQPGLFFQPAFPTWGFSSNSLFSAGPVKLY